MKKQRDDGRAFLGLGRSVCLILLSLLLLPASSLAQTTTRRASARHYANPVFDADFPDPTVIRASDGWHYAYATQTTLDGRAINIQLARSRDLVNWERLPDALPVKPVWANRTQDFWAPDVSRHGDTFYMYFSAALNPDRAAAFKREQKAEASAENVLCLGVATSRAPGGPFTDSGQPMKCAISFANIDPMSFDDARTGRKYLYWGSGFQPIKVQELADDRLGFRPGTQPVDLVKADKNIPFQTLVEGAWVVERGGYYYLFYSGDNCCFGPPPQIKYAVMVARARHPTGPFETLAEATGRKDSVILKANRRWFAPGHNSIITDAAGRDWIAYHAIDARRPYQTTGDGGRWVRRVMLLDRVVYRDGWPRIEDGTPSHRKRVAPVVRVSSRRRPRP